MNRLSAVEAVAYADLAGNFYARHGRDAESVEVTTLVIMARVIAGAREHADIMADPRVAELLQLIALGGAGQISTACRLRDRRGQ
jgi:hypothetical protein